MMPTTSSRPSPVESISTASAAFPLCAASSRSRRSWSARVDQLASAARRLARAVPSAVRNTLTCASGATTVPMSRPSATIPGALAMICRCIAIRCARTCGTAATALTAAVTSRVLIASDTSVPSTRVHGARGSVLTSMTGPVASTATTSGSVVSTPRSSSHQVRARYMAPVSR